MFKKIKSLFVKPQVSKIGDIKSFMQEIMDFDESALLNERAKLVNCLELMENEVKRVRSQANGYPRSTISGDVWFDGFSLASMGEALANHLSDKDFLEEQSVATNIWTGAVLSVCSHYHHMVGPAMIANASINEKTGNINYSKTAYGAVLNDFECILEYAEEYEYRPEGEDLVALQALQTACEKLVQLRELSGVNAKAPEILNRIAITMNKPVGPDNENN
jgi:hypothetical protein